MTANDLQILLKTAIEALSDRHVCDDDCREGGCDRDNGDDWKDDVDPDSDLAECDVTTYERGGYMTRDAGFVLRSADGSEFQITIVQTGYAAAAERE